MKPRTLALSSPNPLPLQRHDTRRRYQTYLKAGLECPNVVPNGEQHGWCLRIYDCWCCHDSASSGRADALIVEFTFPQTVTEAIDAQSAIGENLLGLLYLNPAQLSIYDPTRLRSVGTSMPHKHSTVSLRWLYLLQTNLPRSK